MGPAGLNLGVLIDTHLSHDQDNPHAHNNANYNNLKIVRERGRQVIRKMWGVEQEHDVIGIFYYTRVWHQEGTVESTSNEPSYGQG